ncbi:MULTISPECIES: response regulator transcription factor [Clostridium]|jgi:DNA-binding response OmpR family regulator|uniref:Heme response regulator HssR n=3 Tax=Clostridium TaxID=1485 RepID=A0A1B9BMX6_CLOBE|nr:MULTISPECIES: response regulator transcription factor [Clostridium]ABR34631.1 two component transcriptional regulator, winged helix family [Clostridium beijerinckii NCIMB 8052]AIU03750.1 two component transcriptional regulator [Clostridium beijerinckii ATCC 35702]ALB46319.1 DNA-binding response regulator [Clostridium beijerinckii NRRL B-598]AVK46618.1 two-component system response regulator [Clostridium sp. MF28]MBC2459101.1 response regulator transcription factor [Clostridium beijerinckii]
MFHILIVEDDKELRELFSTVLLKNGYKTTGAKDGIEALNVLDKEYIDLIISDIMMPNMDGFELIKSIRDAQFNLPILMITAKERFQDKQRGFLLGIDDYMVKPIDVNEMVLRVGALLRRAQIISERKQSVGDTMLEYDSLSVYQNGEATVLPQKEFYILYKLISYPNRIFTRQELMDEFWGLDSETDIRTVDVHINRLRDRFKNNIDFDILTVRGLGYKVVKNYE